MGRSLSILVFALVPVACTLGVTSPASTAPDSGDGQSGSPAQGGDGKVKHEPSPADPQLQRELGQIRGQASAPALAVARVGKGGVEAFAVSGERQPGGAEVTRSDRWHLGSETKAMTATLAAALVEQGSIEWDTRLVEVFPKLQAARGWEQVTLEDLLAHRGGAPEQLDRTHAALWQQLWDAKGGRVGRRLLVKSLLAEPPAGRRGDVRYSNAGYAMAAAMLEQRAGASYSALIESHVFAPLEMKGCGVGVPGRRGGAAPRGHLTTPDGKLLPMQPDNPSAAGIPAAMEPAGAVHCTIDGWGAFLAAHLQGAAGQEGYLKKETWRRLHRGVPGGYALGWQVGKGTLQTRGVVLTHKGSNNLWYAVAWMLPGRGEAYVAVTNAASDRARAGADRALWLVAPEELRP